MRLKFEDVKKVPKKKKPVKPKAKKTHDKDGSDFDSEEEYGKEQGSDSDEGTVEYDDGKKPLKSELKEAEDSEEDDSMMGEASEEGEASMEESLEDSMSEDVAAAAGDEEEFDAYTIDPFLVRREATLLTLVNRGFHKRVIVFFNEKK